MVNGPFSPVSTPIFAIKYCRKALDKIYIFYSLIAFFCKKVFILILAQRTWADVAGVLPLTPDTVKEYALHQVGAANHDAVLQALKIPPTKAIRLYIDNGNVGACGVPFSLSTLVGKRRVQQGDRVALMGIGSGLNVMMMGVEW